MSIALRGDSVFLGDVSEDIPVLVRKLVTCLEASAVAVTLSFVGILPEHLVNPLFQDTSEFAADGRILGKKVEVAELFSVKEEKAFTGEGADLVSDVFLFAEEGCGVVVFHGR